eukprot:gnl/MRDRNA2_/MRDRNA2_31271_c0_seq1.p1 gnl/MRDRNA2_/MRDRNA2_31271_c0~~gnl/MRDRNA2_/MRDRNA2_31271_c0_seq1.p1  ORF type:complete len:322 (+),score=44.97 gnl/MRDRNA2_/MRDRNA2_31271_c0_seq1:126-968(+)
MSPSGSSDFIRGDYVAVIQPTRKSYGQIGIVRYMDETKKIEVDFFSPQKDWGVLNKSDVKCVGWPIPRELPAPVDELQLLSADWDTFSSKRCNDSRVQTAWDSILTTVHRTDYRKRVSEVQPLYNELAKIRMLAIGLANELREMYPKDTPHAYSLFLQERVAQRQGLPWKDIGLQWKDMSAEQQLAYKTQATCLLQARTERVRLYLEVVVGMGWSKSRAPFFPVAARRCLMTLLLCTFRHESLASLLTAQMWTEHIFAYIPCYWFLYRPTLEHSSTLIEH